MLNMYMVVHMQNSCLLLMDTDASLRFTFWWGDTITPITTSQCTQSTECEQCQLWSEYPCSPSCCTPQASSHQHCSDRCNTWAW